VKVVGLESERTMEEMIARAIRSTVIVMMASSATRIMMETQSGWRVVSPSALRRLPDYFFFLAPGTVTLVCTCSPMADNIAVAS
jgi:hypothetical protein